MTCTTCKGTGRCPKCNGHGGSQGLLGLTTLTCSLCRGNKVCVTCNGKGRK
jgi:hypothetical protein